jgi:serine/threonine protein kinase
LVSFEIEKRTIIEATTIDWNSITDLKEIGSGSFGKVFKGKYRGAQVAIKQMKSTKDVSSKQIEEFLDELELMVNLKPHPNVVKLIGVCKEPQFAIVLEYMEHGSLEKLVFNHEIKLEYDLLVGIARDVAAGIYHLHSEKIIHRDIACRNILLDHKFIAKISDFGLARITHGKDEGYTESEVGPIRHMAPECLIKLKYSIQSDVWAYGVTLFEMFKREKPYSEYSLLQVASLVGQSQLKPIPESDWPFVIQKLIEDCCKFDPSERIQSFEQILEIFEGSEIIPSSSLLETIASQSNEN